MGPAMPLDMTCASSLAAVHEGAAALLRGEVDLALAGGVNALLSPAVTKFMAELGLLSAGGRCRTFDAGADGYVRGEGCGMLVLKRLRDAEEDGDRIWALVRGSAVNHNGASAGLTVPNGPAQEQVIETALDRAGIPPAEVDYLEAHGTGSTLGDPIEVQAAAAVYGRGRAADRPLLMGTAKTNIGHLEAAAGAAGIVKVVLAMRHGVIPKHLHFENPNPHVDWDRLPVRVTTEPTSWPRETDRPHRAGVSAFGISGTNAHVVVEGYGGRNGAGDAASEGFSPHGPPRRVAIAVPGLTEEKSPSRTTRLLPLSARSDAALQALAGRYLAWLAERNGSLAEDGAADAPLLSDLAWTAGTGRSHFAHRAGVVFRDASSLRAGLRAVAEADGRPGPREAARVAFVYAAEDHRWPGMGAALYRSEPVARAVLDRCDAVLREERNASLLDVMFGRGRLGRRPRRPGVGPSGDLCARVRARRPMGERGAPAERGRRVRSRGARGGPRGRRVRPRGRAPARRGAGRPASGTPRDRGGGGAGRGLGRIARRHRPSTAIPRPRPRHDGPRVGTGGSARREPLAPGRRLAGSERPLRRNPRQPRGGRGRGAWPARVARSGPRFRLAGFRARRAGGRK